MKKFLLLPVVAALAACSSNDDKVAVPAQPVLTVSQSVSAETPKQEIEIPKKEEQTQPKPKPVAPAPVYAPHYASNPQPPVLPSLPATPQPVVPASSEQPKQPKPVIGSSNAEATAAIQLFSPTVTDGRLELPQENAVELTQDNKTNPNVPKVEGAKLYEKDNTSVYVFDLPLMKFQNAGSVFKNSQFKGYISKGKPYTPEDSKEFTAKYLGLAIGTYNGQDKVLSQVGATLNWGKTNGKTLSVETFGSQVIDDNADLNIGTSNEAGKKFDFTTNMVWDSANKQFKTTEDGSFGFIYGEDSAAEVGGILKKQIEDKNYEAVFGASKAIHDEAAKQQSQSNGAKK